MRYWIILIAFVMPACYVAVEAPDAEVCEAEPGVFSLQSAVETPGACSAINVVPPEVEVVVDDGLACGDLLSQRANWSDVNGLLYYADIVCTATETGPQACSVQLLVQRGANGEESTVCAESYPAVPNQ